jgi:SAM-dependent methyltransferase
MNCFYKERYDFYSQSYWEKEHNDLLVPNGFTVYPNKEYNCFVSLIDNLNTQNQCSIIDICCGNGLLLKHLVEHCHSQIIPYGIDFLENSIQQAKTVIHPNLCNNFFASNAINFDFSNYFFDFVLLDPYHFTDKDLSRLLQILTNQTFNSILLYTYADVLIQNELQNVAEFSALRGINNLQTYNYEEISIAVLDCKNK